MSRTFFGNHIYVGRDLTSAKGGALGVQLEWQRYLDGRLWFLGATVRVGRNKVTAMYNPSKWSDD